MLNHDVRAMTEVIRRLFQGARSQLPVQFQDWAMNQMKTLIPFDSGKWITGSVQQHQGIAHSIHLFCQPEMLMQDYLPRQSSDLLLPRLLASPGHTLNLYDVVSREQWVQMDIYKRVGVANRKQAQALFTGDL